MTGDQERLGRVDDEAEAQEESSTTTGPAAEGDYDPAQGSPGTDHPVGEDYPDEAVRYDDPDHPRREEPPQE
jgi:hypothetical protein